MSVLVHDVHDCYRCTVIMVVRMRNTQEAKEARKHKAPLHANFARMRFVPLRTTPNLSKPSESSAG